MIHTIYVLSNRLLLALYTIYNDICTLSINTSRINCALVVRYLVYDKYRKVFFYLFFFRFVHSFVRCVAADILNRISKGSKSKTFFKQHNGIRCTQVCWSNCNDIRCNKIPPSSPRTYILSHLCLLCRLYFAHYMQLHTITPSIKWNKQHCLTIFYIFVLIFQNPLIWEIVLYKCYHIKLVNVKYLLQTTYYYMYYVCIHYIQLYKHWPINIKHIVLLA